MPDKENDPFSANAPAKEAPATDTPATDAPATDALATDALAIDAAPADAPSTEATDAASTVPKLTKAQKRKKQREAKRAARPKPIDTPARKIVAVNPEKNVERAGMVGRVRVDNSHKKAGKVEILDSNGDPRWFSPGLLVEVDQKDKDAFEEKEKESGGKPYYLGGDDDASESDDEDEALEPPPVAKGATVEDLGKSRIEDLLRYVKDPANWEVRRQQAGVFAALLADVSEEKAGKRAALVESLGKTLEAAWTKYEKHRKKHPELYLEEESEEESEEEDYSDVPIDHVKVADWFKKKHKKLIQKCVAKNADLSFIEGMNSNDVQATHFKKALRDVEGESREQQKSQRLAGEEAPPLPKTSNAGESVVYMDSTNPTLIRDAMVDDAHALVRGGTLVPTTGLGGSKRRGGFLGGVGAGRALRLVGVPGATFDTRFDYFAVHESDPVEAIAKGLWADLESCYEPSEWDELGPRLVYASTVALESLPDETSVRDRAKAVYGAYYLEVETHEHEAVWKSTFKAPGLFHTG